MYNGKLKENTEFEYDDILFEVESEPTCQDLHQKTTSICLEDKMIKLSQLNKKKRRS